jgi:hypothetical protein
MGTNASKEEVAEHLQKNQLIETNSIKILLDNDVDGDFISSILEPNINTLLNELGINGILQQTRLVSEYKKYLKASRLITSSAVQSGKETVN